MKRVILPLLFVALSQLLALAANAAVTIRIFEDGSDVAVTWSGSFNTSAATGGPLSATNNFGGVRPGTGFFSTTPGDSDRYTISDALPSLGSGADRTDWDSSSGDIVGLFTTPSLHLPRGYVSGSSLSGSARVNGTTLSAMGLTPGTYTISSTNAGNTDSVVIIVEAPSAQSAATPVPTLPFFAFALLAVAVAVLGRRKLSH